MVGKSKRISVLSREGRDDGEYGVAAYIVTIVRKHTVTRKWI